MLCSLRDLRSLGVEVYFEQEDMWLNEQRIQILLTANPDKRPGQQHLKFLKNQPEIVSKNLMF